MNTDDKILLFDGICNLCNGTVKFIIQKDSKAKFRFAPLQSPAGKILLNKSGLPDYKLKSIVYIRYGKYYIKSTAILFALRDLGGPWKIFFVFNIIPEFIRDFFYDIIAKTRYSIFGKRKTCMVPEPEIQDRFYNQ